MALEALTPLLRDESALTRALAEPDARLAIGEVARPIAVAALAGLSRRRPLVVACPTGTMAGQLADDLAQFLGRRRGGPVPGLGDAAVRAGVARRVETMGRRLELLWRLRDPARCPAVIVAGARALLQRLGPGAADGRADHGRAAATSSIPTTWCAGWWRSGTAARSWSSTAARSPGAARSSTCSPPPATCRCASTCGATRSTA